MSRRRPLETPSARRVAITGIGLLCPLGDSREALQSSLLSGRSGLGPITSIETDGLPCSRAGELVEHAPERYLDDGRNLRPLDRTGRLAAAAAGLALADSGWRSSSATDPETGPRGAGEAEMGLVLGTMFGSVRTISEFDRRALTAGPIYARPMDFANSVINAAAGQTAIWHGLTGVNATVAGGTTAGLQALAYATDLIRAGRAETLLAGGADELCFESFYGFARAGRLSGCNGDGAGAVAVPFHARRDGFVPGEGAALLVLEEERAARRRGARILGRVLGSGNSFDPSLGRDPGQGAAAVGRAVRLALTDAGLAAASLSCLSASASGAVEVDRQEAHGVAAALGEHASRLPVTAVKAALGECLGASGALQTAALLQALHDGELPGIAGLDEPEAGLPLTLAGPHPRQGDLRYGLVTAVGHDGGACALVIEVSGDD